MPSLKAIAVLTTGIAALAAVTATGVTATEPSAGQVYPVGYGPNPALPKPQSSLIPTVKIAEAIGWPKDARPTPGADLAVTPYSTGLDHPRWLYVLPNGDVLVAESNAPPRPEANKGIRAWFMKYFMGKAGAGVKSANLITLLRRLKPDGTAEERHIFLKGLTSPFGMALVGNALFIANANAIVKFPYKLGDTSISAAGEKLTNLPAGPRNHHWTKNIIASKDGTKLYATVGSNSNVGENGMTEERNRAAILEVDIATGKQRVFASGLRNPNGLGFEPTTGALWTVVNERDELGNDLVPDYMTSVTDGGFYGWPYSYFGQNVDTRVDPAKPALVAKAIAPDYALGAHTASLGLAFSSEKSMPPDYATGVFIGQHGSWNREAPSGYKVIFVPFTNGTPDGPPRDVLSGFLSPEGAAYGRPVGVAIAADGALLVADDVGNTIWRVSSTRQTATLPVAK